MPRYVAFLRGVNPMNAKMAELKRCFESAGFTDVQTVLASGNVVFNSRSASEAAVEQKVADAMAKTVEAKALRQAFPAIIRSQKSLQEILDAEPFARHRLPKNAKRVVTFLRRPPREKPKLPPEVDGARILEVTGREVLTAYTPSPRGPVFMALIEKTFRKDITTRTWDTVKKCAAK